MMCYVYSVVRYQLRPESDPAESCLVSVPSDYAYALWRYDIYEL